MSATDQSPHSQHTLVFTGDPDRIKSVAGLNDLLHRRGLTGRLAEEFRPAGPSAFVVPVIDGTADDVLRAFHDEQEFDFRADDSFVDGTSVGELFVPASRGVGHGLNFTEIPAPDPLPSRHWPTLPETLRRPVVALLDTGVRPHAWLPETSPDDPFLIDAGQDEDDAWPPEPTGGALSAHSAGPQSRAGHATFIAGLIRQGAPSARVLSVRVMNDQGRADETVVLDALKWLRGYLRRGKPVDVLCMAFGRKPGDLTDAPVLVQIGRELDCLAAEGVQLVASAGNDHQERAIYPAAFKRVTGVGAGFAGYHTEFSNYGDWVKRYRDGVDMVSIMPGGGWARWSGTSFAAANFAADLAYPRAAR